MLSTIPRLARCLSSNLGGISNLTRAFASWPEPVIQVSAQDGNSIVLPTCGAPGDTLLIRQPERPFAATASLPNEVVTSLPGTSNRIAVVRPAFLPFDQQQQHLSEVIAPLGTSAVALAAHTQLAPQRLLVDEYTQSSSGSYVLSKAATELATYLQRRAVSVALVPDVTAAAAGQLADVPNSVAAATKLRSMQSTNRVLMVAPTAFGFNDQAAQDNSFMHQAERPQEHSSLTSQVCGEFSELHRQLTEVAGVEVQLFQHHIRHGTPDAVFPNNWFSTHAAGEGAGGVGERTLVLYPMKCSNRAAERRPEIIQVLLQQYPRLVDMTAHESQSKSYFEGTGGLLVWVIKERFIACIGGLQAPATAAQTGSANGWHLHAVQLLAAKLQVVHLSCRAAWMLTAQQVSVSVACSACCCCRCAGAGPG
eukprot:GHRR01008359.1.p1 GENE.GHRR01008359.1~~GHRR01008359.1.p1  ORF type:complete len:422 (+),score=101.66 GHRR01008359.1:138-1403(+)